MSSWAQHFDDNGRLPLPGPRHRICERFQSPGIDVHEKSEHTVQPTIGVTFEYNSRDKNDPHPFKAHIYTGDSEHHANAKSFAKALMLASTRWYNFEKKAEERAKAEKCPECETGRLIGASGGGVVCDAHCGYWFCY